MKRFAGLMALLLLLAACGGGSDDDTGGESNNTGGGTAATDPGDSGSSSDGNRLLVSSPVGGIDIVDLDAESQEPFIDTEGQVHSLRLIGDTLWFVDGSDLVAADAASGAIKGRAPMPDGVADMAVSGNTAWVLTGISGASSAVAVIDIETMTQLGSIAAPEFTTYLLIAALGENAWGFGGDVESSTAASKLDATSFTQTSSVDTGILADSMAAGQGAIWIGGTIPAFVSESDSPESGIVKLDPVSGGVMDTIVLGEPADHIVVAIGFGHLWATEGLDGALYKIDAATGEIVDSVDTGRGAAAIPLEIIFTRDLVWVFNTTDDTATGYDPDTLDFEEGINVPTFAPAPIFAP